MACIDIDSKVLCNFNNENIAAALNEIIDKELSKDVSRMNVGLIDQCVDALLELEKEEDNSFKVLIPLMSSSDFLKKLQPTQNKFKSLNVFARASLVAAILAASALTANAAYKNATGVDLLQNLSRVIQTKLEDSGIIKTDKQNDNDIELIEDNKNPIKTNEINNTQETTTHQEITTEKEKVVSVKNVPSLSPTSTATTTTKPHIDQLGDDEEDDETTTTPSTTKKQPENTTEKASIVEPEYEPEKAYVKALEAEYDNFKTDYIYGEELSYNGLKLKAVMSDESKKEVALSDCDYTKSLNMNTTADYTLRIIYENCVVKIKITVRPDEETRGSEICSNDDFDYFLSSKGAYVTRYKGSDTEINMNVIEGKSVYAIGANVFKNSNIKKITAVYVKKIFASAFENCKELENAVFSDNITYLGEAVFRDSAVKELTLTGSLSEIPESLCENCKQLKSVVLPENTKVVSKSAFSECSALEDLKNTNNIETADDFAFYNCENAQTDSSLSNIKKAGEYAFAYCKKIDFGKLSKDIEEFDKYSFAYCNKLTEVTIPEGTTIIPEGAFRGAHISTLYLPEGLKEIDDYAFMSTEFRELNVPDSVEKVGTYGLYSVRLRNISFGKNIEKLGENAIFKSTRLNMSVYKDTVPYQYAIDNKINYTVIEWERRIILWNRLKDLFQLFLLF